MSTWTTDAVRDLAGTNRTDAWRGAIEAIGIEDHDVFVAAVEILRSLEPLTELDEAFEKTPLIALQVVGALQDETYLDQVAALLKHDSAAVRSHAADTVGRLGGDLTILDLALRDKAPTVRSAAIRSLNLAEAPEALSTLRDMAKTERDVRVRTALADALHPRGMWP